MFWVFCIWALGKDPKDSGAELRNSGERSFLQSPAKALGDFVARRISRNLN